VELAKFRGVAQDSTGQVWAIGYAPSLGLYRWGDDTWNPAFVSGVPDNAEPMTIASGSDGAVYCIWNSGPSANTVTRHQGSASNVLAELSGSLGRSTNIFVDPQGNVWITENGPNIYRVTPHGKAECVYAIPDDDYVAYGPTRGPRQMFDPIYAMGDAEGHIWFWSGGVPQRSNYISLEGLLIYDGAGFTHHTHIVDDPYEKVSALAPDDSGHMWMAVADNRLYRVDTKTFAAVPVPEPGPEAFRYVSRVFNAGGKTYVIFTSPAGPVPEPSGEGRFDGVWRRSNGVWKRVVTGLDMRPAIFQDPVRPFLATPTGIWISAYGTGPWFIPDGSGEPVHVDWRYNYPLDGAEGMIQLSDGRVLFVAAERGSIAVKPGDLLGAFQSNAEIRTLNPLRPFIQEQRGHLWGMLSPGDKALSEWNGKEWISHPLPLDFTNPPGYSFATDSQDRIWILSDGVPCQKPAAVLNPPRGNFDVYPDLPTALQAQLPKHPTFHFQDYSYTVPTFSPDGRIGYHDRCGRLHYFDGTRWQQWSGQDITGDPRPFPLRGGPAFFDQAGNFAVNLQETIWEFTPQAGWRVAPSEPGQGIDPNRRMLPSSPTSPPGCEFRNPESLARDRLGTYWMTYRGQLYRAIPGLCLPQTFPQEHQPFIDGRVVKAALVDPQGNAFLETYIYTNPNVGEYVIVNARQPLPRTKVSASVDAAGNVRIHFDATVTGKAWFSWRVDDDAWAHPTQDMEAAITGLANGKHRIEAEAIDEHLQIDPTPAQAEVEIHADNQQELGALIEQLKDPDYSKRDAAVAGLARQPALALPLLQAAREKATPDQRWWIDAAIQRIRGGSETKPGH
jgi:streptogramin lyase